MAQLGLGTRCVQAGYSPKNGEPRQIPIIQSTTFKYESSAEMGLSLIHICKTFHQGDIT